ncbi:hypothetical protein AOQ84DRAFT_354507 [Glonium stellatum]|uniref:Uncharacterized protein n=1 Tax=Glonium stellatum TaxID=574774 RepID=A0A8E2JSZ3_9PEZI|nr:hypothetical protein AOQ84DRAFT_354507 [Glonium stellatum]
MSHQPLTPMDEPHQEPTSHQNYTPHDLPYSESFENSLMRAILYSSPRNSRSMPSPSHPLPSISLSSLPLPLTSPLRKHPSPIPNLLLTHPAGYYTGGPGPSPDIIAEFTSRFVESNNIKSKEELERKVDETIQERLGEVRERMKKREEAVRRNEEVKREIEKLEAQRKTEETVLEKIRSGKRSRGRG